VQNQAPESGNGEREQELLFKIPKTKNKSKNKNKDKIKKEKKDNQIRNIKWGEIKVRWNTLAEKHDWPKIKRFSERRKRAYRTRMTEFKDFWEVIDLEIPMIADWVRKRDWFGFPWIIRNEDNFLKLSEGLYRNHQARAAIQSLLLKKVRVIEGIEKDSWGIVTEDKDGQVWFSTPNGNTIRIPRTYVQVIDD